MITLQRPVVSAARRPLSAWRPLTVAVSFGALLLLAACGGTSSQATLAAKGHDAGPGAWASNCYAGFERDVLALAGEDSLDCGFLRMDALGEQRASVDRCLHIAAADKGAFRAGHIDADGKTLACDVAIRDDSGQLWRLWYDFDLSDRQSQGASDGVLIASRCQSMQFRAGSTLPGSFFAFEGCQEVPPGIASVPHSPGYR
jgi:hypothetical protein